MLPRKTRRNSKHTETHTNKIKIFHNLHYFFTYGYDVDHPGNICPVADPEYHMPNITRDEENMYTNQGASMVSQHKSLPYVTGAGMGWILDNSISKAKFVMQHQQEFVRLHQQKQLYKNHNPQKQQYCSWGQNKNQQQQQFGSNLSQHHQGRL